VYSIWAIQEFEGVTSTCILIPNLLLQLQTWGITCQNTCNIEVHSCKQVLYFLSLPLDNKSFSVRPGVKCKLGAKCKTGTANWGWNVDWVETILTIEFKREWDPIILCSQCAWLTNMILISTFSERQYSSAYDKKFAVQVILIITIQYTWIGKTLPGLCLIKSCWPKILF